jgi:hypothetical protein
MGPNENIFYVLMKMRGKAEALRASHWQKFPTFALSQMSNENLFIVAMARKGRIKSKKFHLWLNANHCLGIG